MSHFASYIDTEKLRSENLCSIYVLYDQPLSILYRDVHQKWIEGGNYELCIEDVRDEIWDMVKPADPLRITLADLLSCKQGGTVASMLIDVRGFWAHDNRENLLQEEEEPEEEQ